MLKHHLKSAFRNLSRNKLYASVSVAGLALGLAVCLLALRYLLYELSFDNVPARNRTYLVALDQDFGGVREKYAVTPPHIDKEMKNYFPEVESATTIMLMKESARTVSGMERNYSFCVADSGIFRMLGLKLFRGNPNTCLLDPRSVVVTGKFAQNCFGTRKVLGRALRSGRGGFTVTGLLRNIPRNSSIRFDAILSSESLPMMKSTYEWTWNSLGVYCFVKLKRAADARKMAAEFPAFIKATGGSPKVTSMRLVPMSRVHFMSDVRSAFHTTDPKYLFILTGIALLIFAVSLFNYFVLSITLLTRKTKEVGIRKAAGASRADITRQFLTENLILLAVSLVGAICISELLLPVFNSMLSVDLSRDFLQGDEAIVLFIGILVIIDVLVSLYSSRFFSSLNAQSLIKGELTSLNQRQVLRKTLIGLQFGIASFLVCCTLVVVDQVNFINYKDLGFDKNNFLIIDPESIGNRIDALKTELRRNAYVEYVTEAGHFPTLGIGGTMSGGYDNGRKSVTLNMVRVDENYIPALGMHLIRGRNFNPSFASDSMWVKVNLKTENLGSINRRQYAGAVILNQEAFRELTAAGAISSDSVNFVGNNWKIIGVLRDYNYSSLRNAVDPIVLQFEGFPFDYLGVKFQQGKAKEVLGYVRKLWKKSNPDHVLQYSFLKDDVRHMYAKEERTFDAILSGSIIAILIALLGIFALSSFLVETKTKEVAVRKVLGSSVRGIIRLLSGDFLVLIAVANMIAWPAAYVIMRSWLQNYAYRVEIDLLIFPLVGATMMCLALATVLIRALRAARANPVEALRYE